MRQRWRRERAGGRVGAQHQMLLLGSMHSKAVPLGMSYRQLMADKHWHRELLP